MMYINLPKPTEHILGKVRVFADTLKQKDNRHLFFNTYGNSINPVAYEFTEFKDITDETEELFCGVFKEKLHPVVGVMHNLTDTLATFPPHCDRLRRTAVNYVVETGGKNTTTDFYNIERSENEDVSFGPHYQYEQVTLENTYKVPKNCWHVFNAQKTHAVHNIENTRILFGVVLASNPSYEHFINMHKGKLC